MENDAYRYAMTRNILYRKGKKVETLAAFEPDFTMMNEWYKQLFGESEGKDQKGLMPTSCIFSTDLHSMGQFLQDGSRVMFETYVDIKNTREDYFIPELEGNFDGLNFLANQNMSIVNRKAMEGTILAPYRRRRAPGCHSKWTAWMPTTWAPDLLLLESLRRVRLSAVGQPLRPARRGKLQKEHVRPVGQARLRSSES